MEAPRTRSIYLRLDDATYDALTRASLAESTREQRAIPLATFAARVITAWVQERARDERERGASK